MKKAVIVNQTVLPGHHMPMGFESLNPFKKTRADVLKKNLKTAIEEEKLGFQVDFDLTYGDVEQLKMDGTAFYIFTPFVSEHVELHLLEDKEYVVLTDEEYTDGETARIIRKMKWLDYV